MGLSGTRPPPSEIKVTQTAETFFGSAVIGPLFALLLSAARLTCEPSRLLPQARCTIAGAVQWPVWRRCDQRRTYARAWRCIVSSSAAPSSRRSSARVRSLCCGRTHTSRCHRWADSLKADGSLGPVKLAEVRSARQRESAAGLCRRHCPPWVPSKCAGKILSQRFASQRNAGVFRYAANIPAGHPFRLPFDTESRRDSCGPFQQRSEQGTART